jgi:hypothetical protein
MALPIVQIIDAFVVKDLDSARLEALVGPRSGPARSGRAPIAPTDPAIAHAWYEEDAAGRVEGLVLRFAQPVPIRFDVLVARYGEPRLAAVPLHAVPPVYPRLFGFERQAIGGTVVVSPTDREPGESTHLAGIAVRRSRERPARGREEPTRRSP